MSIRTPPVVVNFTALPIRLNRICRIRAASPTIRGRRAGSMDDTDLEPLFACPGRSELDRLADKIGDVQGFRPQLQLAGLQTRQVENVIDHGEGVIRRGRDRSDIVGLVGPQRCGFQQARHPQRPGERRAQFMGDGSEEERFRPLRGFQIVMGLAATGHVAADGNHRLAVGQTPLVPLDPGRPLAGAHQHFVAALVCCRDGRRDGKPASDPVATLAAEGFEESGIHIEDAAVSTANLDQFAGSIEGGQEEGVETRAVRTQPLKARRAVAAPGEAGPEFWSPDRVMPPL